MKRLVGFLIITQAIFTGIITYSMQQLSDSIKASAGYIVNKEGVLSWGTDFGMPTLSLFLLIVVSALGIYLIIKKN